MKRSKRAEMAIETVAICDAGSYTAHHGSKITLREEIDKAVAGTRLWTPDFVGAPPIGRSPTKTVFTVTAETTTATLRRLHGEAGGHLACLNFASAKNPGGGFLGGSEAQEEALARSSALYPCLLAAPEYYERNRACRTALYLDLAIWSPRVPFFRDDAGQLLDEPYLASVITAPAPNAGAVATNEPESESEVGPALSRRGSFVLRLAAAMGVRRLVLGAWGCGVFRNDPRKVAAMFQEQLGDAGPFGRTFDEVIFAIFDRSSGQPVLRAFEETFS